MKCDLCERPAVVHEVTVRNGAKKEVHLCEEHATAAGIALPGQQPLNQLLTSFVVGKAARSGSAGRRTCRTCRASFMAFKQTGLLGCPDCYEAFEEQLGPMIERAQNGGVSHAGKCPKRGGASIDRTLHIQRLFRELEDAVAAEQYERAAELRDRLRELEPDPKKSRARRPGAGHKTP